MGKPKKSKEEINEARRRAARLRRERIKNDPDSYQRLKEKEKERYNRRKRDKKILPICEMSPRNRRKARERNRENFRAYYKRLKERTSSETNDEVVVDLDSLETPPQISQKQQKRLSVDDASDGSESLMDLGNEIEVKVEPEDDGQHMTMVADPLTQRSAEGSHMSPHSHAPGDPLQPLYLQPSTSTNEAVIKEEIEEDNIETEEKDYNEMFLKLQQEVETLKADNQRLKIENYNLAREIHNLKQSNDNVQTLAALKDIQSVSKDNELLRELAKENQRLSEKIYENMDQIRNITSKYEHDDESKMNINQNVCDKHKKPDNLTDKLRRLTKDNKNIVSERDNLKDEVQNLHMKLENVSEENIALKRNVKLQRKRVERLKIQCGINSGIIKRLKNNCFKLKSMYLKLKMARQNF